MKELIPVTKRSINETETLTCDSRDLHAFLEVGCEHHEWLRRRIEKYGFMEGVDFTVFLNSEENPGGRPVKHCLLSIDMAKQLAMVENNDKGAEVRRYFIDCERLAKGAAQALASPTNHDLTARSAAVSYRMLARMKCYPDEMRAVFAAKSVTVLTGEPLSNLLPPVSDSRDTWLSPTQLAETFGVSSNSVGRALKKLNLHGKEDEANKWSQPLWDKSRHSNKEVVSYVYNPAVVIPALRRHFSDEAVVVAH